MVQRITQLENALLQTQQQQAQQAQMGGQAQQRNLVETKLMSKPVSFDGSQEGWADWSFVFRAYCTALDGALIGLMNKAATTQEDLSNLTGTDLQLDAQLYYILAPSCGGRAPEKLRSSPEGED